MANLLDSLASLKGDAERFGRHLGGLIWPLIQQHPGAAIGIGMAISFATLFVVVFRDKLRWHCYPYAGR